MLSLRLYTPYVPRVMVHSRPEEFDKKKVVAENGRARFDYALEDKYKVGIALTDASPVPTKSAISRIKTASRPACACR